MSISEKEQQALDSIEGDLAGSGPELAAKLAMFARLTAGEEMPLRERVWRDACAPSGAPVGAAAAAGKAQARARVILRLVRRRAVIGLLWLALTVAVLAVALTANRGAGKGPCAAPRTAACQRLHAPAPGNAAFMPAGHG